MTARGIFSALVVSGAVCAASQSAQAVVLLEWDFEGATTSEQLTSSGSNTSTLSAPGGASVISGGFNGGNALDLTGGRVQLSAAQLNGVLNSRTQLTMSGWFNLDAATDGGIVSVNPEANYTVWSPGNGSPNVRAANSGGNTTTNNGALEAGNWVYLAVAWNNGAWSIYKGTSTSAPTLFQTRTTGAGNTGTLSDETQGAFRIGNISDFGRSSIDGRIDNFRIHDTAFDLAAAQAEWTAAVPEPTSLALVGLASVLGLRRRR